MIIVHTTTLATDMTTEVRSCMLLIKCVHYAYHAAIATVDNTLTSGSCMFTYQIKCLHYVHIMLP